MEKCNAPQVDIRIRKTPLLALRQKILEIVQDYYKSQAEYNDKVKELNLRIAEISGQNPDPIILDEVQEPGGINLFVNIDKCEFDAISSRHEDFKGLEGKLEELNEMFQDLAMLVHSQVKITLK